MFNNKILVEIIFELIRMIFVCKILKIKFINLVLFKQYIDK